MILLLQACSLDVRIAFTRPEAAQQNKEITMLVLSRKKGETIVLRIPGMEDIVISALSGPVRIGVEAPQEVEILRGELTEEGPESEE